MFDKDLRAKILNRVLIEGTARIKSATRSKTVKKYLRSRIVSDGVTFNVPFYWVKYYHDGRGAFGPKNSKYLIYYRNPKSDPRLESGYPRTQSESRRLTYSEFVQGLLRNRELYRQNPSKGKYQFMVITKRVGPTREIKKDPFFDKAFADFDKVLKTIVEEEIGEVVKGIIRGRSGRTLLVWI